MDETKINELEKLITEYNSRHGDRKGDNISGGLMFSHSVSEQIKIFKIAGDREVILETDADAIDGIIVRYLTP